MPQPKHSVETLVLTAAFACSMTDFLRLLDEPTDDRYVRRHLAHRLRKGSIDTSHWTRSGISYTDEALAAAVAASISYAAALRYLGVPVTGGQHAHLARRIRAAEIDTSHFLSQAHRRGVRGRRASPEQVLVVLPPDHLARRHCGFDRPCSPPACPRCAPRAGAVPSGAALRSPW
jgi:hypothetical protein